MQQYDVQVEWQTVQHYLRRGASEMLLELFVLFRKIVVVRCDVVSCDVVQQYANVVSCDVVSCDVVSPDLVLPSVGLSRIRRSRCFRGCLACP